MEVREGSRILTYGPPGGQAADFHLSDQLTEPLAALCLQRSVLNPKSICRLFDCCRQLS